ncbi:hypothetical protein IMY05_017G0117600 [Salix suchowensis]|nr:hypothetical protein IMY05_017G0117600 [Salix suchowensis]
MMKWKIIEKLIKMIVNLIWRLVRSNSQLGETRALRGFFDCVVEIGVPCGVKLLEDSNALFEQLFYLFSIR